MTDNFFHLVYNKLTIIILSWKKYMEKTNIDKKKTHKIYH